MNAHDPSFRREMPNNAEAEQALLGAILVNNSALDRVVSFLEPEHFYEPLHRKIYQVASDLIRSGKKVNPVLIKTFLPADDKVGDMTVQQYLARLAAESVTVLNAFDYGEVIQGLWIRRQAIGAFDEMAGIAYDVAPDKDILAEIAPLEEKLAGLRAVRVKDRTSKSAGQSYIDALSSSYQRGYVRGVPIGINEIAEVIAEPCFEAGNLYGLLSSSGEGKTSLTIQLITHALRSGHPVLFLSYDQSSDQVLRQMVAQDHEIEARRQRDAKLLSEKEFETCMKFSDWINGMPFDVVKCTDQGAAHLVSLSRTFVKRRANGQVPLIVVDHIGAVTPHDRKADEGTKAKVIGQVLKAGAEMTDAAWLVLNQRNSFGMRRDNPRPISMDLFGGDPAKTPFDAIFYLYRFLKFLEERKAVASTSADWKKIESIFPSAVRNDSEDIAEIGAIKVRFGSPHVRSRLIFDARFTRYKSDRPVEQQASLEGVL